MREREGVERNVRKEEERQVEGKATEREEEGIWYTEAKGGKERERSRRNG